MHDIKIMWHTFFFARGEKIHPSIEREVMPFFFCGSLGHFWRQKIWFFGHQINRTTTINAFPRPRCGTLSDVSTAFSLASAQGLLAPATSPNAPSLLPKGSSSC